MKIENENILQIRKLLVGKGERDSSISRAWVRFPLRAHTPQWFESVSVYM